MYITTLFGWPMTMLEFHQDIWHEKPRDCGYQQVLDANDQLSHFDTIHDGCREAWPYHTVSHAYATIMHSVVKLYSTRNAWVLAILTVIMVSTFKSDFRNRIFLSDPAVNNLWQRHNKHITLNSPIPPLGLRSMSSFINLNIVPASRHCPSDNLDDITRQIQLFSIHMQCWHDKCIGISIRESTGMTK